MCFLIKDGDLLKKYNNIWDKFVTDIKENVIPNLSTIKKIQKPK